MRRTSIRFRLLLLMMILTTVPIVLVTWLVTGNLRRTMEQEIISANSSRMLWADQYLSELIQQIDILFYTLQINEPLMERLTDGESSSMEDQYQKAEYIQNTLTMAYYANSLKVDELSLYSHASGRAVSVSYSTSGTVSFPRLREEGWSRILEGPINLYFSVEEGGISAYHSINRFRDRELLGGLSVKINREIWESVDRILLSEPESSLCIFNDRFEYVYGSIPPEDLTDILDFMRQADLTQPELVVWHTADSLLFMKRIASGQLKAAKVLPLANVDRNVFRVVKIGTIVGVLSVFLSVVLSILLSFRISGPIVALARTMQKAEVGSFRVLPVQSRDEVGLLEQGYNSLMERIRELIREEYQREIELRDARILALQSQINPHFLHNTLQLIGGMALAVNSPDIYEVTRVMSELLRYALRPTGDLVSLREEIRHTRNYLFIQEQRFGERFRVSWQTGEEVLDSPIPRFTLQPLVENAFEHGLQNRNGGWVLRIRIKRLGGKICLMILDNGQGMHAEILRSIRERLRRDPFPGILSAESPNGDERIGIGLANVNSRIRLQFGTGYGIRLFSREGGGTLVAVMIPWKNPGGPDV